ncbi:MAG: hypothetical protein AAF629_31620 [Chloroflexota bacterium]
MENSLQIVIQVVEDLEGLLTKEGVVALLTATPDEIVPFSDHELCGIFNDRGSKEEVLTCIDEAIQTGKVSVGLQGRLLLA